MRSARTTRLGSQTLRRGLDVIEMVAGGPIRLGELAARRGLTRSTTHRLASALTDRRYLGFVPHSGYSPGPKLLELGFRVRAEISQQEWLARMRGHVQAGYAFDLEENEDQIRCIAAPIRDVAGRTIAAISVSSAAQYMSDHRMQALSKDVMAAAQRISEGLGWAGRHPAQPMASDAATGGEQGEPSPTRGRRRSSGRRR